MTPEDQKKYFDNPLLAIQEIERLRQSESAYSEHLAVSRRVTAAMWQQLVDIDLALGIRDDGSSNNNSVLEEIAKLQRENQMQREAIEKTIEDNLHLADGDACTLIDLKRALAAVGVES